MAAAAVAAGKAAGAAHGHGEGRGGGGGGGFLGPRVPAEVEAMARGVQEVGHDTFRRLLRGTAGPGGAAAVPVPSRCRPGAVPAT